MGKSKPKYPISTYILIHCGSVSIEDSSNILYGTGKREGRDKRRGIPAELDQTTQGDASTERPRVHTVEAQGFLVLLCSCL